MKDTNDVINDLYAELDDLSNKIDKLKNFIGSDYYFRLSEEHKKLINKQKDILVDYHIVLTKRINDLQDSLNDLTKDKVTQEQIDDILDRSIINGDTIFDKVTLVTVQLPNGFVLTESSGAVSKDNYSYQIGYDTCMKKIEDKLWQLEGYKLASKI